MTAGEEVAHCTGVGWLASYVERPGLFGHFLSPLDHCMSRQERGRRQCLYLHVLHCVFTILELNSYLVANANGHYSVFLLSQSPVDAGET